MGAGHEGAVRVLEGAWVGGVRDAFDVVDALKDDQHPHARPGERVRVETGQPARTHVVAQQPVAGDTGVEDTEAAVRRQGGEALGEAVGPAVVGVEGGAVAVGEGVAEGHDTAGRLRVEDVDAGDVVPGRGGRRVRGAVLVGGPIPLRRTVVGLPGGTVVGRGAGVARRMDGDQEVGPVGHRERHRITDQVLARRDRDRRDTGEGDGTHRAGHGVRSRLPQRDGHRVEPQGRGTEPVGEPHAGRATADADVHDIAEGGAGVGRDGTGGGGFPGTGPGAERVAGPGFASGGARSEGAGHGGPGSIGFESGGLRS